MIHSKEFASYSNSNIIDEGLRNYMLRIYNYMAGGLTATALAAYMIITNPTLFRLFFNEMGYTGFGYLALFAPLILVFAFGWVLNNGTIQQVKAMFWGYSILMGVSLAPIFLVYTGSSIARIFLITAATFGSLSLYGYTTKKDVSGWGAFLFMESTGLGYALSYITVFIFAGLTVYDTQTLKSMYYANSMTEDGEQRGAVAGALSLYLDFINMFMALLRIFGDRR